MVAHSVNVSVAPSASASSSGRAERFMRTATGYQNASAASDTRISGDQFSYRFPKDRRVLVDVLRLSLRAHQGHVVEGR